MELVLSAALSLDQAFGACLVPPPERVDRLEREHKPKSLHKLTAESAELLKRLVKVTEEGLKVTRYVYSELPLLWVVDEHGDLWFSLEEAVDDDGNFIFPKPSRVDVKSLRAKKLGHPALLGGAGGRIGGEILYDAAIDVPPSWKITNRSGRYGLRAGRTCEHLTSAAREFARYGVDLTEHFTPPRES